MMTSALGAQVAPPRPPIYVIADSSGPGVDIKVVGSSATSLEAHYSLEVSSNSGGGTNRSVQSGDVRLLPGVAVTLVTLALGDLSRGEWTARLTVEPRNGAPYEIINGSTGDARAPR